MTQDQWTSIDGYFASQLMPSDPVLEGVLAENQRAGLPPADVAPNQGKLLYLLALIQGARRILEIGTLGGYSTIWLARALPAGGQLISLEMNAEHAQVARRNLQHADLEHCTDVRPGPALSSLTQLREARVEPFDVVFIDADKSSNRAYLEAVLPLCRTGSILIADNVIRSGQVTDPGSQDPSAQGIRAFTDLIGRSPNLSATVIQTVGSKGHDGFLLARVMSAPTQTPGPTSGG